MSGTYFQSNDRQKFTIEPHGAEGQVALYIGRSNNDRGARLCNLYDFDINKKSTIDSIETALNNNNHLRSNNPISEDVSNVVIEWMQSCGIDYDDLDIKSLKNMISKKMDQ
jgi:hypothetical protein